MRVERIPGKSRKEGGSTIRYYYAEALPFTFFRSILKMTAEQYHREEGYRRILKRIGCNMRQWALAKYFNQTGYIWFILTRHSKTHLPTKLELVNYVREYLAHALLQQAAEKVII